MASIKYSFIMDEPIEFCDYCPLCISSDDPDIGICLHPQFPEPKTKDGVPYVRLREFNQFYDLVQKPKECPLKGKEIQNG